MVNSFIAWYLFLAGAGGGAFLIGAVVDLALRRREDAWLVRLSAVTDGGLYVGPASVVLGTVFLLADLGSPERALDVLLSGSSSLLVLGSWAIVLFLGCAMMSLMLSGMENTPLIRIAEAVSHALATVFSVGVIVYSGVYLSLFPTVPFLNNPLVPLLFVSSALSCGMALLLGYGFAVREREDADEGIETCALIDLALLGVEAVLLAVFLVSSWMKGGMSRVSVEVLVFGEWSGLLWLGVVLVGLIIPAIAGVLHLRRSGSLVFAVGAGCSMMGGLCLRYALLLAAVRMSSFDGNAVSFWG